MFKKFLSSIFICLLGFFLIGWKPTFDSTKVPVDDPAKYEVTFVMPKDKAVSFQETLLKGLLFKRVVFSFKISGPYELAERGIMMEHSPDTKVIRVINYNGIVNVRKMTEIFSQHAIHDTALQYLEAKKKTEKEDFSLQHSLHSLKDPYFRIVFKQGSYVNYELKYEIKEHDDHYVLTLRPVEKEIVKGGSLLFRVPYDIPTFLEDDLVNYLRTSAYLVFKTEINSPYPAEATYTNFKRLLKITPLRLPNLSNRDKVHRTENIHIEFFTLPNPFVELYIEVYPYRHGSKAIIAGMSDVKGIQNHIDVKSVFDIIKKKLSEIVLN